MSDFPTLLSYLKRTAMQSGYTMTVDRSMVLKLIAGSEVAEAVLAMRAVENETAEGIAEWRANRIQREFAVVAYRKATGR